MGIRSTLGSLRAFPTLGRRTFTSELRIDDIERRVDLVAHELGPLRDAVRDHTETLTGVLRRTTALEHLVEALHDTLTATDPQSTRDIVTSVQENVAGLTIEVTEQLNRTAELLTSIEVNSSAR